jgi:hypothetical protein
LNTATSDASTGKEGSDESSFTDAYLYLEREMLLAGKEYASGTTSEASTLWSFKSVANYFFVGPDFFLAPLPHWRRPQDLKIGSNFGGGPSSLNRCTKLLVFGLPLKMDPPLYVF